MTVKETDIRGHDDLIHRLTKATAIAVNVKEQDLDLDPLGTLGGIHDPDQDRILQKGLDQVEKDLTVDLLCQQEEDTSEAEKIQRKVHV